jgi:phage portal protein BeeE
MCSADHWRALPDGGRERVTNSALSRILRRPNDYQSRSDFMLKLAGDLYRDGNTYALAQRNDRFEVTALHPFDPKQSRPIISDSGDIFYELAGNNVIEPGRRNANDARLFGLPTSGPGIIVPARDVLHVKLEACRAEPLVGVPPSRHAASAIAAQRALGNQLVSTFGNMNRPAGIIETDTNTWRSKKARCCGSPTRTASTHSPRACRAASTRPTKHAGSRSCHRRRAATSHAFNNRLYHYRHGTRRRQ